MDRHTSYTMTAPKTPDNPSTLALILQVIAGSGIIAVIGRILEHWSEVWLSRRSVQALTDAASVNDYLVNILDQTHAQRAMLNFTSNGGGIPSAAKPLYTTVLYETYDDGRHPIRMQWKDVPLDAGYTDLLRDVIENSCWIGDPNSLKESTLRSQFIADRITQMVVVPVKTTKFRAYFLTVCWEKAADAPEPSTARMNAVLAANQIRQLL